MIWLTPRAVNLLSSIASRRVRDCVSSGGGRLAAKAKRLTRERLEATTVLFTPETVLGRYRRLIAQKYDDSENCKNPGRPRISQEIIDWNVLAACDFFSVELLVRGKLLRCMVLLAIDFDGNSFKSLGLCPDDYLHPTPFSTLAPR
jgi:hypothetical protein